MTLFWTDIDFKGETLQVRKTLTEPRGKRILQTPKSTASRRIISLDKATLSFLAIWKEQQLEEYQTYGLKCKDDAKQLVFSRYSKNTNEFEFFRLAHLNDKLYHFLIHHSELPNITVHGLRHTHASLLFEANVSIKDVQVRLGHSDIKTTMDIYTHVTNSAREKAAKAFEDFMNF